MTAYHRRCMSRIATLALTAALILSALPLAGCGDATGILVEVSSSDLGIPSDVDALRFQAVSDTGRTIDRTFEVATTWPHSLTITPSSATDGDVTITVTAMKDGAFVVRRVVPASFTRGTTNRVLVELPRACVGIECAPGVDCIAGMCVDPIPLDGGVDAGMLDAGSPLDGGDEPDAGTDAGAMDGGPRDAGTDAGPPDSGTDAGPMDAGTPILFFSEYVEGSSLNKALEITNVGDGPADLSACRIDRYSNGSSSATSIGLSGTLAVGSVHVVCHGSLEGAAGLCDEVTASINHNGNDAYALVCNGSIVDIFGCIGFDPDPASPPTTGWSGGGVQTVDYVLRRDCTVTMGTTLYVATGSPPTCSPPFDPSAEWSGAPWVDAATNLTGLGDRDECP